MELIPILTKALMDISRVEQTAGDNDGAYRKQMRIILNSPGVQYAIAKARDAPEESATSAPTSAPKPARKRKPKETQTA